MKHIVCFSGGHSSGLVAIYAVEMYGPENVILLNHDISPEVEDEDIKRFKSEISDFVGIPITFANIDNIENPKDLPDQFDVIIKAGALTDNAGNALCTARLKTEPFEKYLKLNFPPSATLFEEKKECKIYYGFDLTEIARMQRRSSILGIKGYKTCYPLSKPNDLTITNTNQIGIMPPSTYSVFEHANCIGCLKASLLHWYVTFCTRIDKYSKAEIMEEQIDFTIHTIQRDGVKMPISLVALRPIFEQMKTDLIPATEHQSKMKFAGLIRKYQIEEIESNKPCECIA